MTRAALITGASGGVGSSLVQYLAERGWRVYAGVRSLSTARVWASPSVVPIELDVLDEASLQRARQAVTDGLAGTEGLHGLINNAGISVDGPIELLPLADLQHAFAVNVVGAVAVTQAFLPLLRATRGRVVNIGGAAGRVAMPMYGALSASKAALDSITDALRMELHYQDVTVSYIEPGALETSFFARSAEQRSAHGYAGDEATVAIYHDAIRRVGSRLSDGKPAPLGPTLHAIERALTARRPAPRYVVGREAKMITRVVRRLPTGTRNRAIMRSLQLDAGAFTTSTTPGAARGAAG